MQSISTHWTRPKQTFRHTADSEQLEKQRVVQQSVRTLINGEKLRKYRETNFLTNNPKP
jgi:hypothetical protein